jgi:hypothetical protein
MRQDQTYPVRSDRPTWLLAVMVSVFWVAPAATVWGQHPVGNGRALDANLQRGSGGVNQPGETPDFRARNDVVTGNVPGLGYFHDDVGYTAPREFRGTLGGDDLFRFRAQSLSRGFATVSGDGQTPSAGRQYGVYRALSGATGGDVRLSSPYAVGGAGLGASPYRSSGLIVRQQNHLAGAANPNHLSNLPGAEQRIGLVTQPDGRMLEIRASPLLGIRSREVKAAVGQSIDTANPESAEGKDDHGLERDAGHRGAVVVDAPPLSVELGLQMRGMIDRRQVGSKGPLRGKRLAQVESVMFAPLGAAQDHPGDDVYLGLLHRVREDQPGDRREGDEPAGESGDSSQDDGPSLQAPTEEQLRAARERLEASRRARGLPNSADEETTGPDEQDGAEGESHVARLRGLLGKLDYDLPRVTTLAGKKESRLNQIMHEAQGHLLAGRYMDAEQAYRQVLMLQPNHPMAHVGLVHAQVGAGMIRSAQFNLRRLLERYPALIAARYDRVLLPDADRLDSVRDQLTEAINLGGQPGDAMLLAYLGYQAGSHELVEYGLDLAQAGWPDDPLIPLLRRVWLESAPTPPAGQDPSE